VLGVKFLGVWSVLVLIKSAFRTFIWDSRATCNYYIRCKMFFFFFFDTPEKLLAVTRSVDKALKTDVYLGGFSACLI